MFAYRFFYPSMLLLIIASAGLVDFIKGSFSSGGAPLRKVLSVGGGALLAGYCALAVMATHQSAKLMGISYKTVEAENLLLANLLKKSPVNSLAVIDIGKIGFYSKKEIVDLDGLTDNVIADGQGHLMNKTIDPDYLFNVRKPDLIILRLGKRPKKMTPENFLFSQSITFSSKTEARLVKEEQLHRDYELFMVFGPGYKRQPFYGRVVFARKEFLSELDETETILGMLYYGQTLPHFIYTQKK